MVPGEGDLARPREVEVVLLEVVHLGRVGAEEPGARHDLRLHQRRRDHRGEPVLDGLGDGQVQQRQFQPGPDAGEEVEPRPRDLGAALGVDGPEQLAQFEVVAPGVQALGQLRAGADLLEHDEVVLAPGRDAVLDDVGDEAQGGVELLADGGLLGVRGLDPLGEFLDPREELLLLLALGRRDVLAAGLLLGPQLLELRDGRAAAGVEVQGAVDGTLVLAAGPLAGADGVRFVPEESQVDHATTLTGPPPPDRPSSRPAALPGGAR